MKPEVIEDPNGTRSYLMFRHPCLPGTAQGGWKKQSVEVQMQEIRRQATAPTKQFTREEIEKHSTENDCWIVVNGRVYDATSVLSWHPGGKAAIMPHAGRADMQTTEDYESIHDEYAHKKLEGKLPEQVECPMLINRGRVCLGCSNKKVHGFYEERGRREKKAARDVSSCGPRCGLEAT